MSSFVVQIQNYQIIKKAALEFKEGLTVIVGQSSNGKSSIFRAIEAAVYNKAGNSFIKMGETSTAVGIKSEDHLVVWKKSQDAGVYKIDGEVFNKIGRGQLGEVAQALRMSEIDVAGDKVRVNFLKQMEYPFLLDKNGSQLFEFLSMSNENDRLSDIFATMRSDTKKIKSEIDKKSGAIDATKGQIQSQQAIVKNYATVDTTLDRLLALETRVKRAVECNKLVKDIETKLDYLKSNVVQLRKNKAALQDIKSVLDPMESRVNSIKALQDKVGDLVRIKDKLLGLKTELLKKKEELDKYQAVLSSISIEDISCKRTRIKDIESDLKLISDKSATLKNIQNSIFSLRSNLDGVTQEMSSFKVCPLCGKPIKEEEHGSC